MTIEALMEHLEDKSQEEINELLEEIKCRSYPAIAREVPGGEFFGLYEINRITKKAKSELYLHALKECSDPPFVVRIKMCASNGSFYVKFSEGDNTLGYVESDTYHGALKKLGYKVESLDDEVVG